eukprot:1098019-Prorocentrum_minimum.AAC.6
MSIHYKGIGAKNEKPLWYFTKDTSHWRITHVVTHIVDNHYIKGGAERGGGGGRGRMAGCGRVAGWRYNKRTFQSNERLQGST